MAAKCAADSFMESGKARISYRGGGGHLKPFSPGTAAFIVCGLARNKTRLRFTRRKKLSFTVDLKRMKRIQMGSGKESDIVVEICSKLSVEKIEGKFGRRELLFTLLEELCSVDFFRSRVVERASPHKISSIRRNPHARGGTELYSRFLDALEKKANEVPGLLGEIVELVLQCRGFDENSSIQYVFHGTPPENLSSICEKGMDPSLRKYSGDYFGMNAQTSLYYCVKKDFFLPVFEKFRWPDRLSLLVFLLVLPDPAQLTYKLMSETSHELPIAIVELDLNLFSRLTVSS
ncbi:hypothetical protein SUGI_1030200 [Cryptomeria japonica]|nr:hypothetical protein SUGI_1030200 [Cryptomeria japonica]